MGPSFAVTNPARWIMDGIASHHAAVREGLPTGTVTFLFSDIEGSTRLLKTLGLAYQGVLERHATLIRDAIHAGDGVEVGTEGDSFFAVFRSAPRAVASAAAIQRALAAEPWPDGCQVRVRIGLHTGEGRLGGDSYVGLDVNRAARIAAAGHGGQVLLSGSTRSLVEGELAAGVTVRDLGAHRLKDLDQPEQIAQLVVDGLTNEFPPLKTLDAPLRLPSELSSFVGREDELNEVETLLGSTRLLTLLGPGGTGKTRLAIQVGRRVAHRFADGVVFVDLSPLGDPELVLPTIARSIGLIEQADRPISELLVDHLRDRELLIILDNFEQLLPAADGVADLLSAAPRVRALVTSRIVLNLLGEQAFPVPPLGLPDAGGPSDPADLARSEAVALFVDRARAAMPQFALTPARVAIIAAICTRLDGLPLAIELAASRIRVMEPQQLLDRLISHGLGLGEGARNLPARQRTLRSTIDWSYRLLDPGLRVLFVRLAIFGGGCTLEAAESVCNPGSELKLDTLDGMSALVDGSLLHRVEGGESARFRMLETIREYGVDAMQADGSLGMLAARHLGFYRDMAERAATEHAFLGVDQAVWLDRFESELDNLRSALSGSLARGEIEDGLRLAAATWRFWMQRGYLREGREWIERLLAAEATVSTSVRASAYTALGGYAYWLSGADDTEGAYENAVRLRHELGDRHGEAEALYDLAFVPILRGDREEAGRRFDAARTLAAELGRDDLEAQIDSSMGLILSQGGDPEGGLVMLEKAAAHFRASGDVFHLGWAIAQMAQVEWLLARYRESHEHSVESLLMNAKAHNLPGIGANLDSVAALESQRGNHAAAVRLLGASRSLASRTGAVAPLVFTRVTEVEADARATLGDEAVDEELRSGEAMTLDGVVAMVQSLPD